MSRTPAVVFCAQPCVVTWLFLPPGTSASVLVVLLLRDRPLGTLFQSDSETSNSDMADMADRRPLRSSATNRLVVPSYRLSSVGSRAFPVAAAKIWNALPDNLVSATSLQTFRRHLKTFLFQRSFS